MSYALRNKQDVTVDDWLTEIGEGWRDLVRPLVEICLAHGGKPAQIKEKFGGLRFYYDKPTPRDQMSTYELAFWEVFDLAVSAAESKSFHTCEITGSFGRLCSVGLDGNPKWMRTLSPVKAEELGYVYPGETREF